MIVLLGGLAFGAAGVWLVLRGSAAHLRTELLAAQAAENERAGELTAARGESENWRIKCETERLERARFETEARRVVGLDEEIREFRSRIEKLAVEKSASEIQANQVQDLVAQIDKLRDEANGLKSANVQLETQLHQQALAQDQKIAVLTQVRGEIEKDLKNITADALRANHGTFLHLANEVFEKHKAGAKADIEAGQAAVKALVAPLEETLQSYKQQVEEMGKAQSQSYGALSTELKAVVETQNAVRAEASKLATALRASPKTRGRWGEFTLRRVMELSGLNPHCDFSTEESFERDGSVSRPDIVIRLPGGRSIVVDAKTSLSAYLDAVDALEEAERERYLGKHAAQLREHVKQLASKTYWDGLTVTPDFVVMFVPGDNFYAAAVERDPSLFEDAAAQRVIIVTPATLIALAKAVAFGWRQEKVAENAQRVHELGRELYRRMMTMASHIARCGDSLSTSVRHFNQFVGSLERSVMPQARRFNELEVEGTANEIPLLEPIELEPRQLRSDRGSLGGELGLLPSAEHQ
jgi:DNA recombination protein RmuC